ncbi:MAG TPA: hypothetical protein VF898_07000, partial [Chloroflexota bacterium]
VFLFFLFAVLLLASCGGGGGNTGSGSNPGGGGGNTTPTIHTVSVDAQAMVYDATRKYLYVSVSTTDTHYANSVVAIDATTGSVAKSLSVGSTPNQLAISQDARYLYVGLDATGQLARIDLNSWAVNLTFSLGTDLSGMKRVVGSMAVMPGNPGTVAVSSNWGTWLAIFDDGVPRPAQLGGFPNYVTASVIAFCDASTLFAGDSSNSPSTLARITVSSSGLSLASKVGSEFSGSQLICSDGRLYDQNGSVFDAATLNPLGSYPRSSGSFESLVVDSASRSVYAAVSSASKVAIHGYDLGNFTEIGSFQVLYSTSPLARDLISLGSKGFAYIQPSLYGLAPVVITSQTITRTTTADPALSQLTVNRLLYDASRNKIYASVPSSVGARGNTVAVIDPATQKIESWTYVGSEPDVMALSDGAQYLFVNTVAGIVRFNLSNHQVEQTYALPTDSFFGARRASSLAGVPGSPKSFAVATMWSCFYSPRGAGVFVIDDGVQRLNSFKALQQGANIAFGSSSSSLYASDEYLGVQVFNVDAGGLSGNGEKIWPLVEDALSDLSFVVRGNKLVMLDGSIIDPLQMRNAGIYPIGSSRGVVIDESAGRSYFLADVPAAGKSALYSFDLATMVYKGKSDLNIGGGVGTNLISCGSGCFAFSTSPGVTVLNNPAFTDASAPSVSNLPVNHLLYDPSRDRILATLSGGVPVIGNSVAVINPVSRTIEATIPVGSEPNPMGLSPDGSKLYVGLDGTGEVVPVDLSTHSTSSPVWMGRSKNFGALFPYYFAVSPQDDNVVAITRRRAYGWSPMSQDVSILSYGSLLGRTTDPYDSGSPTMDSLAWDPSGNLFAYDNEDTGFDFYRLATDSSGVSVKDKQGGLIDGTFFATIQAADGLIYSSNGVVVDPVADAPVGTFNGASFAVSLALDKQNQVAYFLSYGSLLGRTTDPYDSGSPTMDSLAWDPSGNL